MSLSAKRWMDGWMDGLLKNAKKKQTIVIRIFTLFILLAFLFDAF
jgi:hypothetical protein